MGFQRKLLAAVAALVLLFSACGSDDDGSDAATPSSTNATAPATTGGASATSVAATTAPMQRYKITIASFPGAVGGLTTYVAQSKGYFAEEGLDVELVALSNVGALVSALESGTAHVAPSAFSETVNVVQRGSDVTIIAGLNQGIGYKVLAKPGLDLPVASAVGWEKTVLALKGKTIGVTGGELNANAKILRALMEKAGGSAKDLTFISVNAGGPTVAALAAGQVDAAVPDYGTATLAEQQGSKSILDFKTDTPREVRDIVYTVFLSTDANLQKYPGLDQRFSRAMTKAMDFVKSPANTAEAHRIAVNDAKVPDSPTLDDAIKTVAPLLNAKPTADQFSSTMSFLTAAGLITAPNPPLADFVSPALLAGR